ncbi:hypothetical protein J0H58_28305 [bacterium]|nr:hypothetical protein [bacterium]
MADHARLTIVIEDPTVTVAPGGGTPADDFPSWYPRFRELRNRADMGQQLSAAERSELSDLGRKLTEFANTPAPQQPPAMGPPAGVAGGFAPAAPASTYSAPSPAPPGWNVPGGDPDANDSIEPPTREELDDLRAMFGGDPALAAPVVAYRAPSLAPTGWDLPPAAPPREMRPNAMLDDFMGPPRPPAGGVLGLGEPDDEDRPFVLAPAVAPVQPPTPVPPRVPVGAAATAYPVLPAGGVPDLPPIPLAVPPREAADAYVVAPAAPVGANPYAAAIAAKADARAEAEARFDATVGSPARENALAQQAEGQLLFDQFAAASGMSRWEKAAIGGARGGASASALGGSVAGGAAAGAMEAAGGPVGLAMALTELKDAIQQKGIDGIKALGDTSKSIAGNDYMGLFKGSVEKAAGAVEKIPLVGDAFAQPMKMAAAGVEAFDQAVSAFTARGRELSALSGPLAGAAAYEDVSRYQSDFREAQATGPELAELMKEVADLKAMIREALLPIKQVVVEILAGTAASAKEVFQIVLTMAKDFQLAPQAIRDWAKRVLKALEGDPALIDPIQDWLNAADGLGAGPAIPSGAVRSGADAIGPLPIFTR